jgi:cyclopropane-fatty-acyl-phospholipid synthase
MAEQYGVSVVGLTLSPAMGQEAARRCAGFDVYIQVMDYRDMQEDQFDRIVVVEMIEHIGSQNYPAFFQTIRRNLKENGLLFLQTSAINNKNLPCIDEFNRWACTFQTYSMKYCIPDPDPDNRIEIY